MKITKDEINFENEIVISKDKAFFNFEGNKGLDAKFSNFRVFAINHERFQLFRFLYMIKTIWNFAKPNSMTKSLFKPVVMFPKTMAGLWEFVKIVGACVNIVIYFTGLLFIIAFFLN